MARRLWRLDRTAEGFDAAAFRIATTIGGTSIAFVMEYFLVQERYSGSEKRFMM